MKICSLVSLVSRSRAAQTFKVKSRVISLITAVLGCAALELEAQTGSELLLYNDIPTWLGQGNAAVNGSQALLNNSCVPTSTANGLSFLEQYASSISLPDPFAASPNSYATVNTLQSLMGTTVNGTTVAGQQAGVSAYLATNAPGVSVTANAIPSGQNLANLLNANAATQLGILWGTPNGSSFTATNGGHFVSLVSMNLTAGAGTMNILDPWGNNGVGNNAGTAGALQTLSVTTINITGGNIAAGTYLDVTYTTLVSGPDDTTGLDGTTAYGTASAMSGLIAVDTVEMVPEPTSLALIGMGVLGLGMWRSMRRAKI